MLSKRLRTIISVFIAIALIIFALVLGFKLGYTFIKDQDAKASAIASASFAKENIETTSSEALIGETSTIDKYDSITPKHVKKNTPGAVEIYINYGDDSKDVAEQLKAKGIIDQTTAYNIVAKINGYDGKYQRGTHFVLKGMNFNEIMYNLSLPAESSWVTIPEGSSYTDLKRILKENDININEAKMDKIVNNPSLFTGYNFISLLPSDDSERLFFLEGYLFPDTYQFDLNADEEEIIQTMLRNTNNKLMEQIFNRAEQLDMSLDEVITLASIIQAESGNIQDQYKISRVFHNRMNAGWRLESDASINYLLQLRGEEKVWAASEDQLEMESPYNTYKNEGLPPGPICNPGLNAIEAALYPDTEEMYIYYFVADGDGGTVFANTLAQHRANVEKYSQNWK